MKCSSLLLSGSADNFLSMSTIEPDVTIPNYTFTKHLTRFPGVVTACAYTVDEKYVLAAGE